MKWYIGCGINIKAKELTCTSRTYPTEAFALRAIRSHFYKGPIEAFVLHDGLTLTIPELLTELEQWMLKFWDNETADSIKKGFKYENVPQVLAVFFAERQV